MELNIEYMTSLFSSKSLKFSNPNGDNIHKKYDNLSTINKYDLLKITDPNIIKKSLYYNTKLTDDIINNIINNIYYIK